MGTHSPADKWSNLWNFPLMVSIFSAERTVPSLGTQLYIRLVLPVLPQSEQRLVTVQRARVEGSADASQKVQRNGTSAYLDGA